MNRSLWTKTLSNTSCPPWPCPICRSGMISLVHNTMTHRETAESSRTHGHPDWDPDWIEYIFTAWGECQNPSCKQAFAIAGTGRVEQDFEPGGHAWEDSFSPMACLPMPEMIDLPEKCPHNVRDQLRAAYALFWPNPSACAGRIRVALEYLMDHLGIPSQIPDKNGKTRELKLHARIELFATKEPTAGSQLMALKWLGNAGSHHNIVSETDLLDAFQIVEHALGEIIDRRSLSVAALAEEMTKKHTKGS